MTRTVVGQQNPGTLGSEYNVLAFVIGQLLDQVQTATIVKVISCTNTGGLTPVGRVVVQPMVFQFSSMQMVPHGEIADVPYMRIQGGGNAIILDPEPEDLGICVFASRDISNVKADPQGAARAGGAPPGSRAQLAWSDGLYVGGVLNGNPTQYIRFSPTDIEIVSPTKITLRAPTVEVDTSTLFHVSAGAIDATATGDSKLAGATAELQATGTATVSGASVVLAGPVSQTGGGDASFSGDIATVTGDVTAQGTSLHTHGHNPGTLNIGGTPVTGLAGTPT